TYQSSILLVLPFPLLILVSLLIAFEMSPHLPTALSHYPFPSPNCPSQSSKLVSRSFEARRISPVMSDVSVVLCTSASPPRRDHLSSRSRCPRTANNLRPPPPFHSTCFPNASIWDETASMRPWKDLHGGWWVVLWFGVGRSMHSARGPRFR
ncbi:hypothetical protein BKA70DRAFT_1270643, partial [Coprinopsis sp. MPI-PUGE-AT-0042]